MQQRFAVGFQKNVGRATLNFWTHGPLCTPARVTIALFIARRARASTDCCFYHLHGRQPWSWSVSVIEGTSGGIPFRVGM